MAESTEPAIQECSTCGALIDVTDEQPLALRHCPTCGAAMRVRRTFGPFELQEVLGAGGMGAVYRAHDTTLHRDVALKLLRPEHSQNQELIASFSKEAALTASINHPHVVKVYTTGTDHGVFFIAMELVDKGSLDELMMTQGRIGEAQLLDVGIQVAQGLNAAWQRGLIHRDVKPGNILFSENGDAKIVDFGLAVLQEHANKDDGSAIWGTPYYVAPEKLGDPPQEDFRSDMYSLGATLFHAAAGRPPFDAETVTIPHLRAAKNQLISVRSFVPELSRTTAYVIDKMLHRIPARRYGSYNELIQNLQYARDEFLTAGHAPSAEVEKKSSPWLTVATAAAVVAGGIALYDYRDFLLPHGVINRTTPPVVVTGPSNDELYRQGLDELAAGHLTESTAALRTLQARPDVRQPRRDWTDLFLALAGFLNGKPDEAKAALEKIIARGPYSTSPADREFADFLVEAAKLGATEGPSPMNVAVDFDPADAEAFALLLLGVKDWSLAAYDEATPLLGKFVTAPIGDSTEWLKSLQPLAASLHGDLVTFRELRETPADNVAELEAAIKTAQALREKQKFAGKFPERLTELEATLNRQLTAAKEARAMRDAEIEAADAKLVAEALRNLTPAYLAFRFIDATKILNGVNCVSEKRRAEIDGWQKRTEWLTQFKRTLVADINATGYPQPLLRRNGTAVENLSQASDAGAEMKTRYGNVPVAWADLSIESVALVAQTFARNAPVAENAERTWRLGVFLYAFGKTAEGLAALRQAAAAQPAFEPSLALFPE